MPLKRYWMGCGCGVIATIAISYGWIRPRDAGPVLADISLVYLDRSPHARSSLLFQRERCAIKAYERWTRHRALGWPPAQRDAEHRAAKQTCLAVYSIDKLPRTYDARMAFTNAGAKGLQNVAFHLRVEGVNGSEYIQKSNLFVAPGARGRSGELALSHKPRSVSACISYDSGLWRRTAVLTRGDVIGEHTQVRVEHAFWGRDACPDLLGASSFRRPPQPLG